MIIMYLEMKTIFTIQNYLLSFICTNLNEWYDCVMGRGTLEWKGQGPIWDTYEALSFPHNIQNEQLKPRGNNGIQEMKADWGVRALSFHIV